MKLKQSIRVVTSCRSRFHIFDQARELAKHQMLHMLITDYPKSWPTRFEIPADKVKSLLLAGIVSHGLSRCTSYLSAAHRMRVGQWVHDRFSRKLARLIPVDTQYFIGLSSFSLEALRVCRSSGIICAVDHGSLHQKYDALLVVAESERWGLDVPVDESPDWVIEKEDAEFNVADHVFVMSSVAKDSMVRFGVLPEKIFVNSCGVDLTQFYEGRKLDAVFRIIQVGSVTPRKGVLTLLDAFARAHLGNAELWFVGEIIGSSGFQYVVNKMRTNGVTIHPPVSQAKLRDFYNQCSVFVLASVADGFGMVVLQAMACGLPVIVTENVGAKDLIVDGVNGFIVPVGAPQIIAERLRQLHGDPELCRTMGMAARQTVEKGYAWQDYGDRLVSFLRSQVPA